MKLHRKRDWVYLPIALFLIFLMVENPRRTRWLIEYRVIDRIVEFFTADELMKMGPRVGEKAPEIVGTSLDGETIRLSDFRGKVVFLNFWTDT